MRATTLPPDLSALARRIARGDYRGLRAVQAEVFAYARKCGMTPAELIRSWAGGRNAESAPDPDDGDDGRDRDDVFDPDQECECPCPQCRNGDCSNCSNPDCDDLGCVHADEEEDDEEDDEEIYYGDED